MTKMFKLVVLAKDNDEIKNILEEISYLISDKLPNAEFGLEVIQSGE